MVMRICCQKFPCRPGLWSFVLHLSSLSKKLSLVECLKSNVKYVLIHLMTAEGNTLNRMVPVWHCVLFCTLWLCGAVCPGPMRGRRRVRSTDEPLYLPATVLSHPLRPTEAEPSVSDSTLSNKHLQLILPQFYPQTVEAVASSVVDSNESSLLV